MAAACKLQSVYLNSMKSTPSVPDESHASVPEIDTLPLQLCFRVISGLLRRHGLEITCGGCCGRGCVGVVGLFATGGEAADPALVHARAGCGLGRPIPGWPLWPGTVP